MIGPTLVEIKRPKHTQVGARIFQRDGIVTAAGYSVFVDNEEVVRLESDGPEKDVKIYVFDGPMRDGSLVEIEPIGTEGKEG